MNAVMNTQKTKQKNATKTESGSSIFIFIVDTKKQENNKKRKPLNDPSSTEMKRKRKI
jgi:hypothetical protein